MHLAPMPGELLPEVTRFQDPRLLENQPAVVLVVLEFVPLIDADGHEFPGYTSVVPFLDYAAAVGEEVDYVPVFLLVGYVLQVSMSCTRIPRSRHSMAAVALAKPAPTMRTVRGLGEVIVENGRQVYNTSLRRAERTRLGGDGCIFCCTSRLT